MRSTCPPWTAALVLAAALQLAAAVAHAAGAGPAGGDEPATEPAPARERLPEEITVTGQKLFSTLQAQIRDAEDRMYGLFNELNPDDIYDIHCIWEAPLGTRIRKRECRPEFVSRAQRDEAQNFLSQMSGMGSVNPTPVMAQLAFHYPILADKMKALVSENPALLEAVLRHYELRKELEERKSAYFRRD